MVCSPSIPAYYYNDTAFRTQFPAFENVTNFPEATLQNYWNTAGTIIQNTSYGFLACASGSQALNLMTAHLAAIGVLLAQGQQPGFVENAGIDKISVGLQAPPAGSQFQWWLNTTPYGQQLAVLLSLAAVGGFYTPGGQGRSGFSTGAYASWPYGAYLNPNWPYC